MSQGLELKKQQFKNYLQQTGALDQISKIFTKLFQEPQKPSNTMKYILEYLGVLQTQNVDQLLKQYQKEQLQTIKLKSEIARIKKQIDKENGL